MFTEEESEYEDYHSSIDLTMFWEFYRWERYKLGDIYLQIFPNRKMYAGQTINWTSRMKTYRMNRGSNSHHSNALKLYSFEKVLILRVACPWYLLDAVEIFLIEYYDLMNPEKGYNKTSGGRRQWNMSNFTRIRIGEASRNAWKQNDQRHIQQSSLMSGDRNPNFGKKGELNHNYRRILSKEEIEKRSGPNNYNFGKFGELSPIYGDKHWTFGLPKEKHPMFGSKQTSERKALTSGSNHYTFGQPSNEHHMFGKKRPEHSKIMRDEMNPSARPVCVYGKVFSCAQNASDTLRAHCDTASKGNFIAHWTYAKKRKNDVFYVTKDFYKYVIICELDIITRDFYDIFMKVSLW
jgi:hypothetical protein